jgi:hypothetical protein
LLALRTGELTITYLTADGREEERAFDFLGEHLLRDRRMPSVIYQVAPEFRLALPKYAFEQPE